MTVLDDRLHQLVQEMVDCAPVLHGPPLPASLPERERPRHRPILAVAVVVFVVAGLLGWWRVATRDGATEVVPRGSLERLGPDDWVYPTFLPEGIEFDYALRSALVDRISFASASDRFVSIGILDLEIDEVALGESVGSVEIGGRQWIDYWGSGAERDVLVLPIGGRVIEVHTGFVDRATAIAIAASLEVVDGDELPRPPLDMENGPFAEVARARSDGAAGPVLEVITDGVYFAEQYRYGGTAGGGGCCMRLDPGEYISIGGGTGAGPTRDGEIPTGPGTIHGIVHPDVASVDIHLTDGSVVTTEPQDLHDSFTENFLFATIPDAGELGLDRVAFVVAYDADGNELDRASGIDDP